MLSGEISRNGMLVKGYMDIMVCLPFPIHGNRIIPFYTQASCGSAHPSELCQQPVVKSSNFCQSDRWEMISQCGFNLHSSFYSKAEHLCKIPSLIYFSMNLLFITCPFFLSICWSFILWHCSKVCPFALNHWVQEPEESVACPRPEFLVFEPGAQAVWLSMWWSGL